MPFVRNHDNLKRFFKMSGTGDSLNNAIELGKRAVSLDQEGKIKEAASYYEQAAQSLENLAAVCSDLPQSLVLKAVEYKQRAAILLKSGKINISV